MSTLDIQDLRQVRHRARIAKLHATGAVQGLFGSPRRWTAQEREECSRSFAREAARGVLRGAELVCAQPCSYFVSVNENEPVRCQNVGCGLPEGAGHVSVPAMHTPECENDPGVPAHGLTLGSHAFLCVGCLTSEYEHGMRHVPESFETGRCRFCGATDPEPVHDFDEDDGAVNAPGVHKFESHVLTLPEYLAECRERMEAEMRDADYEAIAERLALFEPCMQHGDGGRLGCDCGTTAD